MISSESLENWVTTRELDPATVHILEEKDGARAAALEAICNAVADHLYGAEILARLGFTRTAEVVQAALPTSKRIRSGDLAEILATEYVRLRTDYAIPLKRLRYKDDREMSMRGDDLIGVARAVQPERILKGEVKSRARLADGTLAEACDALERHDHRPKPATLAFIARMLRLEHRDEEATIFERFQSNPIAHDRITHFVFVMCGNDPANLLVARAGSKPPITDRRFVGLRIQDHQNFISEVFGRFHAGNG